MFKLKAAMPQALKLAAEDPKRFEVGSTGWVTARFTAEEPLPKRIWGKWLTESHEVTCEAGQKGKKAKGANKSRSKPG